MSAAPGKVIPRASARLAIVDAVPITVQCPALRETQLSISQNSSSLRRPARTSSQKRRKSVPEPSSLPCHMPRSMGPPGTMIAGTSALAAPINWAGVVLSHPQSSTTPSRG